MKLPHATNTPTPRRPNKALLVNLELITTDLSRQRPYRFPLPWLDSRDGDPENLYGPDQLYVCLDELAATGMFGDDVLGKMVDPEAREYPSHEPGGSPLRLHRLPDPWNLPVVFAVRLSLALPGLFKAVRLFRLVSGTTVRDDLGRAIKRRTGNGVPLKWPEGELRAEELWFSDGGIASNFPVNLFDALLPSWPTFGLNLGSYPYGFPQQDVWLPQDWQATRAPVTTLPPSGTGFLNSIVDTARSWRDTMQTGMPGYRGRIAWVRQRPDEGGTNLFMPREIIASLALRGALAGARLARRFRDDTQWDRHRWLRLRIALDSLQHLRTEATYSRPAYDDALEQCAAFLSGLDQAYPYDPYSAGISWYQPGDARFWVAAKALLDDVVEHGRVADAAVLTDGGPKPHPSLKQIPPI